MFEFVTIISILILLALFFIVPVLFKTNRLPVENYDERNTQIARERLQELEQNLASGEISQADFDAGTLELEKNLAIDLSTGQQNEQEVENSSKPLGLVLIALVPVLAAILYMQLGEPGAINGQPATQVQAQKPDAGKPKMTMQEAMVKLADRLKEKSDDPQGWYMLARTYMATQRYEDAVKAYEKTIELIDEEDADLLVRYADALAMTNEGSLKGKPRQIIEKALSLNPQHQQGLWLAGVAAIETEEFKAALKYFLILQPMMEANPEARSQLQNMIGKTKQKLTQTDIKAVQASLPESLVRTEKTKQVASVEIEVTVSLDESLKQKVSPQDAVFIYAKAMSGPPMPLAAVRKTVSELPLTITLNDAMAMMPAMKLSSFAQVKIGAKISKSGVATASAGDLFGELKNINVKSSGPVSVIINQVRE